MSIKHLPAKQFNAIKQNGFVTAVNARVIHEWLGVKTDFTTWVSRRINKYGFIEHVDYCITKTIAKVGEANEINYLTTKDYQYLWIR